MSDGTLDQLREQIGAIDRQLVSRIADRLRLAREIGEEKQRLGLPVRSYQTEFEVLARFKGAARADQLDERFIEGLARELIGEAVRHQEWHARGVSTDPKQIVVIGGSGKMGAWLSRFFSEQGHAVTIVDPAEGPRNTRRVEDWDDVARADVVLLAMPLSVGPAVLDQVLDLRPIGLVADISSLKSHLIPRLKEGVQRGIKIVSLHPLFGPAARTLGGRVIAICDCGDSTAVEEAAALFEGTAADIVRLPIEDHDDYMQYVLGLSHLVSILFANTLAESGKSFDDLSRLASTTFHKQARTAVEVARENPKMYYEIQRLNRHSEALFDLLRASLEQIERASLSEDRESFVGLMERAREYFPEELPPDLG